MGYDGHKKMKGSKIHAAVSEEGLPLNLDLSAGNDHDSLYFTDLADEISVKGEKGRLRTRPGEIAADPAYDTENIREYLRKRGIKGNIPVNKRNRKNPKIGRPTRFNKETYKIRGSVERFNGWLDAFKRVATRYERLKTTFMAFLNLACLLMIWRVLK